MHTFNADGRSQLKPLLSFLSGNPDLMCIVYVRNRASSISSYILKREREKERKRNKKVVVVVVSLDFEAFIIANEKSMESTLALNLVEVPPLGHFERL